MKPYLKKHLILAGLVVIFNVQSLSGDTYCRDEDDDPCNPEQQGVEEVCDKSVEGTYCPENKKSYNCSPTGEGATASEFRNPEKNASCATSGCGWWFSSKKDCCETEDVGACSEVNIVTCNMPQVGDCRIATESNAELGITANVTQKYVTLGGSAGWWTSSNSNAVNPIFLCIMAQEGSESWEETDKQYTDTTLWDRDEDSDGNECTCEESKPS